MVRRPRADRLIAKAVALVVPLALVIWLAGGPVVLAVPLLAGLGWWRPSWLPPVALGSMLLAGVVAAGSGSFTALGSGAFGGLAQAFALVALTAALMPAIVGASGGRAGRSADLGEGAR
jgi:arabinofuranan 3-O-arabinosyltransferase